MPALPGVPRAWPSHNLPGYREYNATYAGFAFDELPLIERELDDELRWLLREPPVPGSLDGRATREELDVLLKGRSMALPRSFATFLASEEPSARIRSCTDCYLRLAEFIVPVGGGRLINFLSDSQAVLYWLLYVGPDGEAVVATDEALGFRLGDDDAEAKLQDLDLTTIRVVVCANSFSEFLYRFWIENEIWFSLVDVHGDPRPLTDEERRYAEHYTRR